MKRLAAILTGLGLGYLVATGIAIVVLPGLSALVYGELLPQLADRIARLGW